ncbi:glutamine synthetase family protein [Treponema zioleckii]|uniref:glutamine synthetase family protein n=1 Tax=Treponema zioleckii TaxID=331680 RepID=UPI00168AE81D|nr:glutamine synthetase family protein [Treponema zioleckii]
MYTQSEVLDFIQEEDVKFIRLAYFDVAGKQKNISIMPSELERAFREGIAFDASAVRGFEGPEKSDLFLFPDPSTLAIIPWRPMTGKVVRMFCDIQDSDGKPYSKDCRTLLKKSCKRLKDECGIELIIGTEIEFYLFCLDEKGKPTKEPFDTASYMDIAPEDHGENIRRDICFTLEQMGITPEASHHEEGPGQNEIDFMYSDALTAADNVATFKWIVNTKAASNGLYADFSPKPLAGEAGNGMHINLSYRLANGAKESGGDENLLPYILGGIYNYIEEITCFLNPVENSYIRLGSSKAPKYISWGKENRSAMIRLPASKSGTRLEVRSPDPMCNPYIAIALLINAAIEGIKNKITAPASTEENLFDNKIASKLNLRTLPQSLEEAKAIARKSDFVKSVLGEIEV